MLLWVQDLQSAMDSVFLASVLIFSLRLPCFFLALQRFWPITILLKQIFRI
jgi:hypothetical protein